MPVHINVLPASQSTVYARQAMSPDDPFLTSACHNAAAPFVSGPRVLKSLLGGAFLESPPDGADTAVSPRWA